MLISIPLLCTYVGRSLLKIVDQITFMARRRKNVLIPFFLNVTYVLYFVSVQLLTCGLIAVNVPLKCPLHTLQCPQSVTVNARVLVKGSVKLDVTVSLGSGQFDICENESVVASGRIAILTEDEISYDECPKPVLETGPLPLNSDDIYKELRLRGYDYGPTFRGILSADGTGKFYSFSKMVICTFGALTLLVGR